MFLFAPTALFFSKSQNRSWLPFFYHMHHVTSPTGDVTNLLGLNAPVQRTPIILRLSFRHWHDSPICDKLKHQKRCLEVLFVKSVTSSSSDILQMLCLNTNIIFRLAVSATVDRTMVIKGTDDASPKPIANAAFVVQTMPVTYVVKVGPIRSFWQVRLTSNEIQISYYIIRI